MLNKSRLARAALQISQMLGAVEEWDEPDQLIEGIAQALHEAGVPALDSDDTRAYWRHMNVDDALGRALVDDIEDDDRPHTFNVNIDASTATPETIAAIFQGMHRMIHGDTPVLLPPPGRPSAHFLRSADL